RLAQLENGSLDRVAGQEVVLSPRDAYFVEIAPRTLGLMQPANRQELARWLRFAKQASPQVTLSPYLVTAAAETDAQRQIVLALAFTDVVGPEGARQRLGDAKSLEGRKVNLDQLVRIFAGLKGMVLAVRVGQAIEGELRVDFTDRVEPLLPVAKPLLLE